ncbi:MAG: Alpha-galacturonidase [Spirochaetes bacterium ADurb.Bin110]|nr:MAG: Alpha-galacturonidase [Spirochaetes bacterium ADurb.Bin110]
MTNHASHFLDSENKKDSFPFADNDNPLDLVIAYIGGGSRGWAWTLMSDLALEGSLGGIVRLYDIDKEAAEINARIGNTLRERNDVLGKWRYEVAEDLESALRGADFVIASILPGTFGEMASDVHAPEEYGIYQSVGDTTGPGGILRGLRTIPMYEVIGKAIREFCPKAWVVNYTNPMALCLRTLYEVFPDVKAFGCCHEVFGTRKLLAAMVRERLGAEAIADAKNATMQQIEVNVLGINHFTWIDRASFGPVDLLPHYRAFVDEHFESGYEGVESESWLNSYFASAERVKFDLFRRYGLIAAAGDRHLAEFMPGRMYLRDPEIVRSWKFSLTPVSWRIENAEKLRKKAMSYAEGREQFMLKHSGEEGVNLIKALCGLGSFVSNVNLPNHGQIKGLPLGAVVETNAIFWRDCVQPVDAGRLPSQIEALVAPHAIAQDIVLRAAMRRDAWAAFPAFLHDPLMTATPSEAEALFASMLRATAKYLADYTL